MAIEPGSPEWWLRRLHGQLVSRRGNVRKVWEYYDGEHKLAFASKKFRQTFGGLFDAFADNWCGTVVDASEERLNILGFRVGEDPNADEDAHAIWQRNEMDAQSQLGHTEALVSGEAYATVWNSDVEGQSEITLESADTAIVARHPKFRSRRLAGLRMYLDEKGYEHAELFLPERVWLYKSKTPRDGSGMVDAVSMQWAPDDTVSAADAEGTMENPLGVVPMVPLENRPRLRPAPAKLGLSARSEIISIIPLQDACNKLVADLLVSSEFDALQFRYVTGYEVMTDPTTGEVIPPPFTDPQARWAVLQEEHAKVGALPAGDLAKLVKAIELLIDHIAAISRTPPHYLNPGADRLSGESIKAAESGLVSKVRRKQTHFGAAWEEVIRLAGAVEGNAKLAGAVMAETIWGDPEIRTESQHADALVKRKELDVPVQQLWEDAGYTPAQIRRFESMRMQDELMAMMREPVDVSATAS